MNNLQSKAERGDVEAQYELSWRLALADEGSGQTVDPSTAIHWLHRAALGGHPLAQNNLGARYLAGDGMAKDLVAAWCWFQLAAEGGDRKAAKNRETAASQMDAEQLKTTTSALEELRLKLER